MISEVFNFLLHLLPIRNINHDAFQSNHMVQMIKVWRTAVLHPFYFSVAAYNPVLAYRTAAAENHILLGLLKNMLVIRIYKFVELGHVLTERLGGEAG
ncbi:hypothetical protein D3C77_585650 [compost metagenome]